MPTWQIITSYVQTRHLWLVSVQWVHWLPVLLPMKSFSHLLLLQTMFPFLLFKQALNPYLTSTFYFSNSLWSCWSRYESPGWKYCNSLPTINSSYIKPHWKFFNSFSLYNQGNLSSFRNLSSSKESHLTFLSYILLYTTKPIQMYSTASNFCQYHFNIVLMLHSPKMFISTHPIAKPCLAQFYLASDT